MEEFKLDNNNGIIGGVCAGLANYFKVDVTFLRLLFTSIAVIHPCAWLFYILLWVISPETPEDNEDIDDVLLYRSTTVVDTTEDLFNTKLIQESYIGKIIYVKSEKSLYLLVSNDYENNIIKCWKKMENIETKNIEFNTPIFVYLKGKKGEALSCISNGIITDSDGNIWVKMGDEGLYHIDDLAPESKDYILDKLKQENIC